MSATGFPDDRSRLAVLRSDENNRTPRSHDPVDFTRDAEPAHIGSEGDQVHIARRQSEPHQLSVLIGEEEDLAPPLPARCLHESFLVMALSDETEAQPLSGAGAPNHLTDGVKLVHDSQVSGIHHDEMICEAVFLRKPVFLSPHRLDVRAVTPVGDPDQLMTWNPKLMKIAFHTAADDHDTIH